MRVRISLRSAISLGAIATLFASGLTVASPAQALTAHEVRVGWVDTYAAPTQSSPAHLVNRSTNSFKNSASQSTINVTYTDVPQAEQSAVQAALNTWSQYWQSSIPVNVSARYLSEGNTGILASASPVNFFQGFTGAPDSNIWYPSAMANALAGKDLDSQNPEIQININSTMASSFYLGTDGNCPSNQYDLESIILHEMAHGLGFLSNDSYDPFFGYGTIDQPTPFDAFAQTPDGTRLMDIPSPSAQLGSALQNTLTWSGALGIAANNNVRPVLYTPKPYEPGSSVSHLDSATFQGAGANALMTPSWPAGAVFHTPGSLVVAMLQDMRTKPPAGKPAGIPTAPRSVTAVIADKSAIINFIAPDNARTSLVSSYTVKVDQTGQVVTAASSPITISHLVNGNKYTFSVSASNALGTSPTAQSNPVIPQAQWKNSVIDSRADAKNLATTTFRGQQVIAYTDSKTGDLKLATWTGKIWQLSTIDGNSDIGGRTRNNVAGALSVCTSPAGANQRLDIFYSDMTNKWLRYAGFDGKKWSYSVVDGNGPKINAYADSVRVATSSDVTGANACVDTPDGLQVFYRDQSQGIILGAVKLTGQSATANSWSYELVDGDRATDGRTTGDVGFHMNARNVGRQIYLLYDSVLQVNARKSAIEGEVRLATRASAYPEDWKYQSLDTAGGGIAVAGYDVSLSNNKGQINAAWLGSNSLTLPNPSVLRYVDLTHNGAVTQQDTSLYGMPLAPVATDGQNILFNCQQRLCSFNSTTQTSSLISTSDFSNSQDVQWLTLNGVRYALAGVDGALKLFKSP